MSNETIEKEPLAAGQSGLAHAIDVLLSDDDIPPIQPDQEWANALTHGIASVTWIALSVWMVMQASEISTAMMIACAAYGASVIGTFACSTLSHTFLERPLLDRFRAWDQAMIYLMIAGTYTPIMCRYAEPAYRDVLLLLMWGYAFWGFAKKAIFSHRIHSISTLSYLLLGWLPAIPLYGRIPMSLFLYVLAGGVAYSIGVLFLKNDHRVKYFHAVWHIVVISASILHFAGIMRYVIHVPQ
ncbi:PAQR family membrane homeostasis protein TrhA [Rhodopirellula sp. SWK7]|uniref:PAQR family membrane homeostasis protein TrhA n=1 Tax=Rhodopirellula sp. SWK7 TaxID=595460 RepID=UPI0002BF428E|nr:hemolysin III family protein [Rhodopirellula sp. SWK7]EMI46284.1 Hly-III related protein [Rhodopirellula sp. SWK7]